jgi:diguanylate cyclase (GGDEF)-like protein
MGVTALDMPGFMDLVQNNGIGKTGSFLVFSPRAQTIVTATEPELRLKPTPAPGVNRLHDQAMAGWRGTGITINAKGVETLATFVSVPSADWVVVARMPTAEALRPTDLFLKSIVRNSVLATLILVTVLIGILGVVFRPLRTSSRQMRLMADGTTPLAKIEVVRPDEVGEMVESFNLLVEKLQNSEAQMTYLAHHDALTELPNRHSFMESMQQSLALADRQSNALALLFIDLDGFKLINDQYGHEVGDQVLKQVATRLQESVRQSDLVGRLGGDEFVVLLTDNPDHHQAGMIANKVIGRLSEPYIFKGVEAWLSASIGIARFPEHSRNLQALFASADTAMYAAKRAGRSQYQFAHAPSPSQAMGLTQ